MTQAKLIDRKCRNPECGTTLRVSRREEVCVASFCGSCPHPGRMHLQKLVDGKPSGAYLCSACGDEWSRGKACATPYGPVRLGLDRETEVDDPDLKVKSERKRQASPEAMFDDADTRTGRITDLTIEIPESARIHGEEVAAVKAAKKAVEQAERKAARRRR